MTIYNVSKIGYPPIDLPVLCLVETEENQVFCYKTVVAAWNGEFWYDSYWLQRLFDKILSWKYIRWER